MWWILWLGAAIALLGVELVTSDLVSIWLAVAAFLLGIVTAIFPWLHLGWQIFIFAILSAALLFSTRPLVKKFLKKRKSQETNLELILGHVGIVEEDVNNDLALGAVKINGLVWSARSEDGSEIEKGEFVVVQNISGNKLIVKKREIKEKN
jgi:membrane protein implicated in regulation of membrane protease activity